MSVNQALRGILAANILLVPSLAWGQQATEKNVADDGEDADVPSGEVGEQDSEFDADDGDADGSAFLQEIAGLTNVTNTGYEEIQGVRMPGRACLLGMEFSMFHSLGRSH